MLSNVFITLCLVGITLANVPPLKRYLVPEDQMDLKNVLAIEEIPSTSYEYQIVPSSEYAVSETFESPIADVILSPITAIMNLGSTAVSTICWILPSLSLVLLGIGLVIGFCAFTTHCTLIVDNPFSNIPYLEDVEHYFTEAYHKYHEMQNFFLS